jgi:hypothetical protein
MQDDAVDRIERILGDSEMAGGLSRRDIALNIARELGHEPHDPPVAVQSQERQSQAAAQRFAEAQRVAQSAQSFTSGIVPEPMPSSTSARVTSGGTASTSARVSSGGSAKADDKVTSGGSTKATA